MTLICRFSIDGVPAFISNMSDPGSERSSNQGQTRISDSARNIKIIGDNLVMAFTGNSHRAKAIAKTLQPLANSDGLDIATVENAISAIEPDQGEPVEYIGVIVDRSNDETRFVPFDHRAGAYTVKNLEDVCAAGSGSAGVIKTFEERAGDISEYRQDGHRPEQMSEIFAINIASSLQGRAHFWDDTFQGWSAGAYEVLTFKDGKPGKLDNVLHLFWDVKPQPDGSYGFSMRSRFVKQQDVGDDTIFRIKETKDGDVAEDEYHFCTPANLPIPASRSDTASSVNWTCEYICSHVGIIPRNDGPLHVITFAEPHHAHNPLFMMQEGSEGAYDVNVQGSHVANMIYGASKHLGEAVQPATAA